MHIRFSRIQFSVLAILLTGLLGTLCPIFSLAQATPEPATSSAAEKAHVINRARFMDRVIELTNLERAKAGLSPLKRQDDLSKASRWLAEDMAAHNYFAHTDRTGRNIDPRLPDFGYTGYAMIGENIAGGQQTPEEVVAAWMNSPGHRANLMNPDFREIGVAYVRAPNSELQDYWVQDFGTRRDIFPLIINNDVPQTKSPDVRLYVHGDQWAQKARFSNDGAHWTSWQAFQSSLPWTLPAADGKQTVYVELTNGREIRRASATIEVTGNIRTASAAPDNTGSRTR